MEVKMNKIPVSFYGVAEGCKPKYCGWKYVTELDSLELKNWLHSGNQLYFKKYGLTVTGVNQNRMLQVWRWLRGK
jgi:hypothetical protein